MIFFILAMLFSDQVSNPQESYKQFLDLQSNTNSAYQVSTVGPVTSEFLKLEVFRDGKTIVRHSVLQQNKESSVEIKETIGFVVNNRLLEFSRNCRVTGRSEKVAGPLAALNFAKSEWKGFSHSEETLNQQMHRPVIFDCGGVHRELLPLLKSTKSISPDSNLDVQCKVDSVLKVNLNENQAVVTIGMNDGKIAFLKKKWNSEIEDKILPEKKVILSRLTWCPTIPSQEDYSVVYQEMVAIPRKTNGFKPVKLYDRVYTKIKPRFSSLIEARRSLIKQIPKGVPVRIEDQPQFHAEWTGDSVRIIHDEKFESNLTLLASKTPTVFQFPAGCLQHQITISAFVISIISAIGLWITNRKGN